MIAGPGQPSASAAVLAALAPGQRLVAEALGRQWDAAGEELYLVGGIVRDALLGRELPADLDLTTSALPGRTEALATAAGARSIFLIGQEYGTVGAVFGADPAPVVAEITTYRAEHYPDETRFPAVRFGVALADDLSRRDFTANAIAADPRTGRIVDPFGGQADIAQGVLRAVGDPDERFAEDPLRLLRAARFVAHLGFRIDPATELAMRRQAASLGRISQERILAELTRLLTGTYVEHGLELLRRTDLIDVALPELAPLARESAATNRHRHREKDLWDHTLRVVRQAPPHPRVRWAALLHDAAKPLTRGFDETGEVHFFGHERVGADLAARLLSRLKADKATQSAVARLVELHGRPAAYEPDWTDSAVRRLVLEAGEVWPDLLDLAAADVTSGREAKRRQAANRVRQLRDHVARLQAEADLARLQSPLDGDHLMRIFERGPGIWIKHVKDHLREQVIDGALRQDDAQSAEIMARAFLGADENEKDSTRLLRQWPAPAEPPLPCEGEGVGGEGSR
ncbi:MAG: HD domain-containing protein [Chloroflexia bacterium]|nr:HD domain-containing protein [Chloroflexia bacterium]